MKPPTYVKHIAATALLALGAVGMWGMAMRAAAAATPAAAQATIVLVHGALADSSSWDGVVSRLQADGYTVIAAPNPLRGLKHDSDYVSLKVKNVGGPVVLVGHSYGGSVITNAAISAGNVQALVYVAGFAPDAGESALDLATKFPGSQLAAAFAQPITLPNGAEDLYVQQDMFQSVFAADLPAKRANILAATQRPVTNVALTGVSGAPAWKSIPSWFIYGSADNAIPPAAHAFMANRAGARQTIIVQGASHLVMVSHPSIVAKLIEKAAVATSQ
jgi:pimeloyl-ACP methyl ester carboxylesterase